MDHKRFTFLLLFLVFQPHWISGGDVICSLEDYVLTGIEFGDCQSEAMKSYGSDDDKDRNPCAELKNVVNNCARLVSVRTCNSLKSIQSNSKVFHRDASTNVVGKEENKSFWTYWRSSTQTITIVIFSRKTKRPTAFPKNCLVKNAPFWKKLPVLRKCGSAILKHK